MTGSEMSQTVLTSLACPTARPKYLSDYPLKFSHYIIGPVCANFYDKADLWRRLSFPDVLLDDLVDLFAYYGLARYYIWYLVTGRLDLEILRRQYDGLFYVTVYNSNYQCFLPVFETAIAQKVLACFIS
jgi:hypothetical protein